MRTRLLFSHLGLAIVMLVTLASGARAAPAASLHYTAHITVHIPRYPGRSGRAFGSIVMKNTGPTMPCPAWGVRSAAIKLGPVSSNLGAPLHRETFEGWLTSTFRPLPREKTLIIRFRMTYSYHAPVHEHTIISEFYATCRSGLRYALYVPDARMYF